jgi:hypothetical protein
MNNDKIKRNLLIKNYYKKFKKKNCRGGILLLASLPFSFAQI